MNKHFDSLCFVKFNNFVCTYFLLFPKQYTYMFSMLFFIQYPDPDPGFKFLWIRFSDFSGSGSGFQIFLDLDSVSDSISDPGTRSKGL